MRIVIPKGKMTLMTRMKHRNVVRNSSATAHTCYAPRRPVWGVSTSLILNV